MHEKLEIVRERGQAYGIRDATGFLLFFRTVHKWPGDELRYRDELLENSILADFLLKQLQGRAAESVGAVANGEQLAQPAKCLDCEYWQKPRGGFCLRGDRDTYCVKVGTQQAGAQ